MNADVFESVSPLQECRDQLKIQQQSKIDAYEEERSKTIKEHASSFFETLPKKLQSTVEEARQTIKSSFSQEKLTEQERVEVGEKTYSYPQQFWKDASRNQYFLNQEQIKFPSSTGEKALAIEDFKNKLGLKESGFNNLATLINQASMYRASAEFKSYFLKNSFYTVLLTTRSNESQTYSIERKGKNIHVKIAMDFMVVDLDRPATTSRPVAGDVTHGYATYMLSLQFDEDELNQDWNETEIDKRVPSMKLEENVTALCSSQEEAKEAANKILNP